MKLSTCAVDGATIRYVIPEDGGSYWEHVNPALDGHRPDPDDGYVSGPGRDDLPPCTGCGHPEHEEGCEEEVSTGLYGTDGVLVYAFCACTGPAPEETHLAFQSTVQGEEGWVCTCGRAHAPDPWTDPDAAAAASPPPF